MGWIKNLPTKVRWLPGQKVWKIEELNQNVLLEFAGKTIQFRPKAKEFIRQFIIRDEERTKAIKKAASYKTLLPQELKDHQFPVSLNLYGFQKQAVLISETLNGCGLFLEPGLGKTIISIASLGRRYLKGEINRVLVVSPTTVMGVWEEEFKYAQFPYELIVLRGSKIEKTKGLNAFSKKESLKVLVINYESVWRIAEEIKKWNPEVVVADECHRIKNRTAKQSKCLHYLGLLAKTRLALTGTPITEEPLDLWSQFKFLDPQVFSPDFYQFRKRYAIMGGFGGYEVMRYINLPELHEKAYQVSYRLAKEEALELPDRMDLNIYFDLTSKERQMYQEMEDDFLATINEDVQVEAPIALVKLMKLQQITCGFLKDENEIYQIGNSKLEALKDLLLDVVINKAVIFVRFIHDLKQIKNLCDTLSITCDTLYGKTQDKDGTIKRFQEEKNTQVLIVQLQTGGLGITLTAANVAIFYSMSHSNANYIQAKDRIHRVGQTKKVTYYHLLANKTVDLHILHALQTKQKVANYVVDELRKR